MSQISYGRSSALDDGGDSEIDHGVGASTLVDLGEFVLGAGEADLKSFDFAEPAFAAGSAMRAVRLSRISAMRGR